MAETKEISLLEQTVVDVINKSVSSLEKGAEFLAGQLPDIAQQYLHWKFAWAAVVSVFLVIILFVFLFPVRKWVNSLWQEAKRTQTFPDRFDYYFPYGIITAFVCAFSIPAFFINLHTMVYIYVAPKVYLIEWAKSFIH